MAKIRINGETFDFDGRKQPMSEALVIEQELKMRFAEYADELQAGSVRAMAGFIWCVWHRDGRDVTIGQILSGEIDIDIVEVLESMIEAGEEIKAAQKDAADPKPGPALAGIPMTATVTSRSSRKSST